MHPFIEAMSDFLVESGRRAYRPSMVNSLMWGASAKYEESQKIMMRYIDKSRSRSYPHSDTPLLDIYIYFVYTVLEDRKVNPTCRKDILSTMLSGVDKETGQKLSDDSIKRNVSCTQNPNRVSLLTAFALKLLVFLIAGMLS